MKHQFHFIGALAAWLLIVNPVLGEPQIAGVQKTYVDGSSVALSCLSARRTHCQLLVSFSGGSRRFPVDFSDVGEVPTLEHIELIGFSNEPVGGAVLTSVECRRRDEGILSDDVPDVMCFKLIHLSRDGQIIWGATEVRGQLEPVTLAARR